MKNIWQLLFRYHLFLLFIALQTIALQLLIRNNNYQRSVWVNSTNSFIANLYDERDRFSGFLKLRETNDALKAENTQLRAMILENYDRLENHVIEVNDTILLQQYIYTPAKVINLSLNSRNNYITLNKGSLSGIQPGMGVTSEGAVVGFVKDVSSHFCSVIPVINPNFATSVRMMNGRELGRLVWQDIDPIHARVLEIPNHAQVGIGDTIISSGFGNYFPKGSLVGLVTQVERPQGENAYEIKIELSVDFRRLEYVEVIEYLYKEEKKDLESDFD